MKKSGEEREAVEAGPGQLVESDRMHMEKEEIVLSEKVRDTLGAALRAYYDDIVNEPIPDKFLVLLAQLDVKKG